MLYVVISRAGSYELSRNNINTSHGFYGIDNFTKAATVSNRDAGGGGAGGAPQVLGYHLTQFGQRGQIMPHLFGWCGISGIYIAI